MSSPLCVFLAAMLLFISLGYAFFFFFQSANYTFRVPSYYSGNTDQHYKGSSRFASSFAHKKSLRNCRMMKPAEDINVIIVFLNLAPGMTYLTHPWQLRLLSQPIMCLQFGAAVHNQT